MLIHPAYVKATGVQKPPCVPFDFPLLPELKQLADLARDSSMALHAGHVVTVSFYENMTPKRSHHRQSTSTVGSQQADRCGLVVTHCHHSMLCGRSLEASVVNQRRDSTLDIFD